MAMKAMLGVASFNAAYEDIRLVSTAIDNRLPWNTTVSIQSELHVEIRGYPCDRVVVTCLGDDEVK
jgi:uncharacterized protein (DUF2267 family)